VPEDALAVARDGFAELDAMCIALLVARSSRPMRFLRSSRGSGRKLPDLCRLRSSIMPLFAVQNRLENGLRPDVRQYLFDARKYHSSDRASSGWLGGNQLVR
jgi:hypothetical protein